ncbi:urocortin [Pogona vitticeps]
MRRARLPVLAASLLLLSQVLLQGRPALAVGAQDDASLWLKLRLRGQDPARAPWALPSSRRPDVAALLVGYLPPASPAWEFGRRRLAQLSDRLKKRQDPPLSIDLTFHLLRQMMEISRAQSQQAQAEKNRLLLDSVGK